MTYMVAGMEVKLTPNIVRNYLVSGDKEKVTLQEIAMFMNLCKFSGLNPWVKEAYCIKYGNEPATMVVAKDAFQKRAEANPNYDGFEAGIIIFDKENFAVDYRKGTLKLPGEEIIGGYAEVWRKDRSHATRIEVSFDEYAGRKKDGSLNAQWSRKPATMIRKVALVQALRETFPSSFGGMYAAEEFGYTEESTAPDIVDAQAVVSEPEPKQDAAQEIEDKGPEVPWNAETYTQPAKESVNAAPQANAQGARGALFGRR